MDYKIDEEAPPFQWSYHLNFKHHCYLFDNKDAQKLNQ
jgi:hypothetical protein